MKALFLGTLAASQAMPIIEFITADIRTEIIDINEPAQAAAALADADVLLTGAWRSGFPAAPKLRLLKVPLAGTDGIDVSSRFVASLRPLAGGAKNMGGEVPMATTEMAAGRWWPPRMPNSARNHHSTALQRS